jgi:hypothetical protein
MQTIIDARLNYLGPIYYRGLSFAKANQLIPSLPRPCHVMFRLFSDRHHAGNIIRFSEIALTDHEFCPSNLFSSHERSRKMKSF